MLLKNQAFDNLPTNRSNVAIGDKSLNIKPNSRPSLDECFALIWSDHVNTAKSVGMFL